MSVDSNFYFQKGVVPSFLTLEDILKKEGYVISFVDETISNYNCYHFGVVGINHTFMYSERNSIFGGILDGWINATLSTSTNKDNVKLLEIIGKYFGGYFVKDESVDQDSDDYMVLIEKEKAHTTIEESNETKFKKQMKSMTGFDHAKIIKITEFIKENKELVIKFLEQS